MNMPHQIEASTQVKQLCGCPQQVYACSVIEEEYEAVVMLHHREKKWKEKFQAHEWTQEKICQKWKENRKEEAKNTVSFDAEEEEIQENNSSSSSNNSSLLDLTSFSQMKSTFTNFANAAEVLLLSRQFDSLLRGGIPVRLRGRIWWMCSGAQQKKDKARQEEQFQALVMRAPKDLDRIVVAEIEKDLHRTFPEEKEASQIEMRLENMNELRRILQAYSLRNPIVGYCQSMNFLAAVLLHLMEEEEAFWVLAAMVEELIPQYHTRSMCGSRADQRVFADLVEQKLPDLYHHMQHLDVQLEPLTLKWFLCLFLNTLPYEPVMRIWDVFFCEGSHILLRIALVLMKLNQDKIMKCEDAFDVYEIFRFSHETLKELTAPYRTGLLNRDECLCDTIIRLALDKSFVGTISLDSLYELRQYHRNDVEDELAEAEARRYSSRSMSRSEKEEILVELDMDNKEYDFVEDFESPKRNLSSPYISPIKHIHFKELFDSADADYFVDVRYDRNAVQECD
jgi:hypothetical protein